MTEIVHDVSSRLLGIKGQTELKKAYSRQGDVVDVDAGRCLYLVRFELSDTGHPELVEDIVNLDVRTTWDGVYRSKQLRGPSDDPITFEELTVNPQIPPHRAKNPAGHLVKNLDPGPLGEGLEDVLQGRVFNCYAGILSEYSGHWQSGFGVDFDKARTYLPVVVGAIRDVADRL